ncbi:MAG TPA: CBS domain-containing protein [Caulifigura sp.]|jgi:CBS domain-containing protein|nr:CBS domain-containing protein [Caulifigura sp.]
MSVKAICAKSVDTASPEESAQSAASRMHDRKVGTLVVVDEANHPIGMLTDRDLTVRVVAAGRVPEATTVQDVMSPSPVTVTEATSLENSLATMRRAGVRRVPVVDSRDRLVGLLSIDDVLILLHKEFSEISRLLVESSPGSLALA